MLTSTASQRWVRFTSLQTSTRLASSPFRFKDLPIEVAMRILALAVTTPAKLRTYRSLVRVCRDMRVLVLDVCLQHLPVVLLCLAQFESFCGFINSNPTAGSRIRSVWFVAGITVKMERTLGLEIVQKCPRIARIGCNINLLRAIIESPSEFALHHLKQLTLIEPKIPWHEILSPPTGRRLFGQLTHLRVAGGTQFDIHNDFCFTSLTHLSFTCHSLDAGLTPGHYLNSTRFPVLQRVVPSVPYMHWRLQNPTALRAEGRTMDDRLDVIACPKKWKELDVWENGGPGERDLWERARTTEFLQRSRAFTELPPSRDYFDFSDDF